MRVVYYAEDGKEFDNEYDCEQYERSAKFVNLTPDKIDLYDEFNNKMDFDLDDFEECVGKAYFLRIKDENIIPLFQEEYVYYFCELSGLENIKPNILFHFNEWGDTWYNYEKDIQKKVSIAKKMGVKIGGAA